VTAGPPARDAAHEAVRGTAPHGRDGAVDALRAFAHRFERPAPRPDGGRPNPAAARRVSPRAS
jgi:hypothetical protein